MPSSPTATGGLSGSCPQFHEAIELIGRRWNGVILQHLLSGPLRFAEIAKRIPGITDAMLSQRLKELEGAGIVSRIVSVGRPVEVRYSPTAVGVGLVPVFDAIAAWSTDWAREAAIEGGANDAAS